MLKLGVRLCLYTLHSMTPMLLFLYSITAASALPPIPPPQQIPRQSTYLEFYSPGDSIELQFNHLHSFQSSSYQRQSPIRQSYIIEDFQKQAGLYFPSNICRLIPPGVSFTRMINISTDFQIKDIEVDFANTTVFVLSADHEIFKLKFRKSDHESVAFEGKFERLGKVPLQSRFASLYYYESAGLLFTLTQSQLYILNTTTNQIALVTSFVSKNITRVRWYSDRMFALSSGGGVYAYRVTNKSEVVLEQEIQQYNQTVVSFIDVHWSAKQLWLLSNTSLYIYKFDGNKYIQYKQIAINYGQSKFLEKAGRTVQLVFELNNNTYIAQMAYINETLILNRFYDQMRDVLSLTFLNDLMLIMGREQIMITHHSINQHLLSQKLDLSVFSPSFSQKRIEFPMMINYEESMLVVTSTSKQVYISKIRRTNNKLQCKMTNPQPRYSIYIQMKTTVCTQSVFQNTVDLMGYCSVKMGIQLQQVSLHNRKTSNLIALTLSCIIVLIAAVVVGLSIYLKNSRQRQISILNRILQRKKKAKVNQEKMEQAKNLMPSGVYTSTGILREL